MKRKANFMLAVLIVIFLFGKAYGTVVKIYWTEASGGSIKRSNLDGTGVTDLITDLDCPMAISIDVANGKVYWAGGCNGNGVIQCANLDGSCVETLVSSGLGSPSGIALDTVNDKIYWTDFNKGKIQRSNLDGSGIEDIFTGLRFPKPLAIDLEGGKLYWGDSLDDSIRRCNLDGSEIEIVISAGLSDPSGIALDLGSGKLYWTDADGGVGYIQRANIDGTNIETIVTDLWYTRGIVLDTTANTMYWADARVGGNFGAIRCATLDGSNITTLYSNARNPIGIAIGPIPEPATLFLLGLGAVIVRKKR